MLFYQCFLEKNRNTQENASPASLPTVPAKVKNETITLCQTRHFS